MEKKDAVDDITESDIHSMLIESGVNLLTPPSTVDKLLVELDDAELILGFLRQDPSSALLDALLPCKTWLVYDKLLRHPDMDVKLTVLSCIHEVIRITAPLAPYEDDIMKEIFHQTVIAFEKLTAFSGRCYTKASNILEIAAKYGSCSILLDIGCDALITQIFKVLFVTIRPNHPDVVLSNMEGIMTCLIEESDEISIDLMKPLLSSVKKENQKKSPLSGRLGMKVLQNCSGIVKPCLIKAVEQMNRDIELYTDALALICPEGNAETNVMKEGAKDASKQSGNRDLFQPLQIIAMESVQPNHLASEEARPKRRGRKPNHSGVTGFTTSSEASGRRNDMSLVVFNQDHESQARIVQRHPLLNIDGPLTRARVKRLNQAPTS